MDRAYRDATTEMETRQGQPEYILGWQGGYLGHPLREEQRLSDAYEAGYQDGGNKTTENFGNWLQTS